MFNSYPPSTNFWIFFSLFVGFYFSCFFPGPSPLAIDELVTPKRNLLKDLDQGNPSTNSNSSPKKSLADSPRGLHNSLEGGLDDAELLKIGSPRNNTPKKEDLERTAKSRASER